MKHLISIATVSIGLILSPLAMAATQQEKMKTCNADAKAKALKGEERKTFMSTCLKAA